MKYVLDTNTLSAVMRSDPLVLSRLRGANRRDVVVPQPVFAEVAYGIARLPKSRRRQLLDERFEMLAGTFDRIEWTDAVSDTFGRIKASLERKGQRIEDFDAAIAAHALANGATLVTGNVKHMTGISELLLEDWLVPK
ncbi:MAG TPA: PIN domain-containing protein [Polyangiaceae bacterium]|nr:PIN domain-containing protein [Polyangiaceae bacterium]